MAQYEVKLIYKYSDTITVNADSKQEAIEIASRNEDIEETYDCFYDAEATELSEGQV